jgi:hypothetical protein
MRAAVVDLPPTQRRWRDLSKLRLFLSLAAAPLLPTMLGLLLVFTVLGHGEDAFQAAGTILGAAIAWSLVAGVLYLLIVVRWRDVLGRMECLMLGIATATTLPFAAVVLLGQDTFSLDPDSSDSTAIAAILAIMIAPFGLLGGWVFWRLGVRPSVTTVGDVAPLFD